MNTLPDEIIVAIVEYAPSRDLVAIRGTCRRFCRIVTGYAMHHNRALSIAIAMIRAWRTGRPITHTKHISDAAWLLAENRATAPVRWASSCGAIAPIHAMMIGCYAGDLTLVRGVYRGGYRPRRMHFMTALEYGHLRIAHWMRTHGYRADVTHYNLAIQSGSTRAIGWLRHNYGFSGCVCAHAIRYGHLHLIEWDRARGCGSGYRVVVSAAIWWQGAPVFREIIARGLATKDQMFKRLYAGRHLRQMRELVELGETPPARVYDMAFHASDSSTLQFLEDHGLVSGPYTAAVLARDGVPNDELWLQFYPH